MGELPRVKTCNRKASLPPLRVSRDEASAALRLVTTSPERGHSEHCLPKATGRFLVVVSIRLAGDARERVPYRSRRVWADPDDLPANGCSRQGYVDFEVSFLAFFAAFRSFGVIVDCFLPSFLDLCSFDM